MSLLRAATGVLGQQGAGGGGNSYSTEVLADSPVGYWKLDDASGNFADSSGNGNTATASGTNLSYSQTALIGGSTSAARFFGAAVHGNFGTIVSSQDDCTLELWHEPESIALSTLIEAGGTGTGLSVEINASGKVVVSHADSGLTLTSTTTLSTGTAYHIVATSELNVGMYLHIDGTEEDSELSGTWGTAVGTDKGTFGARDGLSAGSASDCAEGFYDEVAVYNTALSAARIQAHYDARNTA